MKIYIDSTDNARTIIRIDSHEYIRTNNSPRDQDVFGFLQNCLKQEGKNTAEITEIQVNPGPGSFTGTRIGVTIANALGFALGLKVNNMDVPIKTIYSQEPSITLPKSK